MQPFQRDEHQHLTETLEIVKRNIEFYTKRVAEVKKENDELNDSITPARSGAQQPDVRSALDQYRHFRACAKFASQK